MRRTEDVSLWPWPLTLEVEALAADAGLCPPSAHQLRRPTNGNECWTPQPVWSAVPTSSTEACHDSIPSYIGWMSLRRSESCTNSASWCSTAFTVKRIRTSWNCANQSQVSLSHHGISDTPPTASSHTSLPAQLLWPTGFLCGWSDGLEFPVGQLAESDYWRSSFRQSLKTFLFATYWCIQRVRGFMTMRYINRLFTYLLTLGLTTRKIWHILCVCVSRPVILTFDLLTLKLMRSVAHVMG